MDFLVEDTIAYVVDIFLNTTSNNAQIYTWVDTNKSEMKVFISLLFHMGTIKLNGIEDYWKKNMLFNIPFFVSTQVEIDSCYYFGLYIFLVNPKKGKLNPRNRLYKIRPILDYFNLKMKNIYESSKNLLIDKSMVLWQERLIFHVILM